MCFCKRRNRYRENQIVPSDTIFMDNILHPNDKKEYNKTDVNDIIKRVKYELRQKRLRILRELEINY